MKRRDFLTQSVGLACAMVPGLSLAKPCPPILLDEQGNGTPTGCGTGNAEADWQARTSGPGVVWFHDFRSEAEVNAFRWAGGKGNDPNDTQKPNTIIYRTGDGITGGGCLEAFRPTGSTDGAAWWRPYSPLQSPGNGKAANDPGANGSISPRAWDPSDTDETQQHSFGYYGHPSFHNSGQFDGAEYYLQMRVKLDSRRIGQAEGGKLLYQTLTAHSLSDQEIVVESFDNSGIAGTAMFSMYRSGGPPLDSASNNQPGNELGVCDWPGNVGNCWAWEADSWDCIMFHIVPGVPGSAPQTQIQVFAAHRNETSFTKIWDQFVNMPMESNYPKGYNAMIASQYMNGFNLTEFFHRYDQIIFSKSFIPCPQV
ncbi:MAG: hypothetical protein WD795_05635 [Woeseia sp.]